MVFSSQTTSSVRLASVTRTDVAMCWENLAGMAASGATGCNSQFLPNPHLGALGDTETGHAVMRTTLPFWKVGVGRWERCNISPTGGRQHVGNGMSSNGWTQGDDLSLKGVVVLRGATWADRRIAQACNAEKNFRCGVVGFAQGQVKGVSGQNLRDTVGPPRGVDNMQTGKPRVRNICAAKGSFGADCRAKFAWVLVGLHHCESSRKIWLTWEVPCYTSRPLLQGRRQGMGAAVIRFKRCEWELSHKSRVLGTGQLETGPKTAIGYRACTCTCLDVSARSKR